MTRGAEARVLVLADTHVGHHQVEALVDRLRPHLARADVVLHAGDITDPSLLDAIGALAPVHAVRGNNDWGVRLPERRVVELAGCSVAMVHDSGSSHGRAARLRARFPDADVVVFGHSHLPWNETHVRDDGHVQHHLNPGSPTQRRMAPACTVAWLDLAGGRVAAVRHETIEPPALRRPRAG
jgi:putative phosphoesterase